VLDSAVLSPSELADRVADAVAARFPRRVV
jgi:hypothetical protein